MNQQEVEHALSGLPLGEIHYFDSLGSTNDEALARMGSLPNLSLIIADEQTEGRGRAGRRWLTPHGAALAFSVILHPSQVGALSLFNGLGALAISEAFIQWGLAPAIKWPNDVLLHGRKVAGILPESQWNGEHLLGVVLGIGINVRAAAIPPEERINFPAGCVETALGRPIAREKLLREVLTALIHWLQCLETPGFVETWEKRLAFRGEWVKVIPPVGEPVTGQLAGLTHDGHLRLKLNSQERVFTAGEIQLRPIPVDKGAKISTLNQ